MGTGKSPNLLRSLNSAMLISRFNPQEQAGRYSVVHSTGADPHHVLMVYKGSKYTATLQGILGNPDGPTEVISWRWGWLPVTFVYNVWIFKEGAFELQSDGGYVLDLDLDLFSMSLWYTLLTGVG